MSTCYLTQKISLKLFYVSVAAFRGVFNLMRFQDHLNTKCCMNCENVNQEHFVLLRSFIRKSNQTVNDSRSRLKCSARIAEHW